MQFLDRPRGPSHSRGIPPIGRGAEKHLSCTLLVDSGHLANSALQLVMMVIHPKMILTSCRNVIHVSKSLTMSHTKIVIVCNTVRLLTYQKKLQTLGRNRRLGQLVDDALLLPLHVLEESGLASTVSCLVVSWRYTSYMCICVCVCIHIHVTCAFIHMYVCLPAWMAGCLCAFKYIPHPAMIVTGLRTQLLLDSLIASRITVTRCFSQELAWNCMWFSELQCGLIFLHLLLKCWTACLERWYCDTKTKSYCQQTRK
jgi:hypothetical protein